MSYCAGPAGLAMIVTAVMQHLGQLLQDPLPSALRPLLQNYPDELLRFAHSGGTPSNAAGWLAHVQHQVQQVRCNPTFPSVCKKELR